jgi:non-ribosomal peptide synthetase component F
MSGESGDGRDLRQLRNQVFFANLLLEQQAIRAKCFHPTGAFVEFKKEEVEQSIPDRFERRVGRYPDRIAVKTKANALTYAELNQAANRVAHAILDQSELRRPDQTHLD